MTKLKYETYQTVLAPQKMKDEILEKVKAAVADENYFILLCTPKEIYEAINNASLVQVAQWLDYAHFKKLVALANVMESQQKEKKK